MTQETFQRLESSLPIADLVFLQGWGEPFLHPRLWDYVERVDNAGTRVGLTTNGVFLNAENRKALIESGLEILGVSLAGSTAATHHQFRGGNPLAVIDDNLRALREEKDHRGPELPRVHLACTENVLKICFVTADGDVSPCVMANVGPGAAEGAVHRFHGENAPLSSFVFGNVNDKPLEKIWRSKPARDFRRVFLSRDWTGRRTTSDLPPMCRSCNKLFEA